MTRLFGGMELKTMATTKWADLQGELGRLSEGSLADAQAVERIIAPRVAVAVPVLRRDETTMKSEVGATGTRVTFKIPFTGSGSFLYMRVPTAGTHPVIQGDITAVSRHAPEATILELEHNFATDVTPEQVREWGKARVDEVEQELELLRGAVDHVFAGLRQRAESLAADRLTALRKQRTLDEGLGRGI